MSTVDEATQATEKVEAEQPRGERGELGVATPALTIKQHWHRAHFSSDKKGQKKRVWVRKGGTPSLKQFARQQIKQNTELAEAAKEWLANKGGAKNAKRSDANIAAASEAAAKSRAARRKSSGGKK